MSMRIPDGMLMGDGDGRIQRVFAPPWWALWRWLWWAAPWCGRGLKARAMVALHDERGVRHDVPLRLVLVALLPRRMRGAEPPDA